MSCEEFAVHFSEGPLERGPPLWLSWQRSPLQCGRPGFDPWVGMIPGEGKGYPLQYPGLENSMERIVHGVAKSRTGLSNFHSPWNTEISPEHLVGSTAPWSVLIG